MLPGTHEWRGRLEGEGVGHSPGPGVAQSSLLTGVANAAEEKERATRLGSRIVSSLSLEIM